MDKDRQKRQKSGYLEKYVPSGFWEIGRRRVCRLRWKINSILTMDFAGAYNDDLLQFGALCLFPDGGIAAWEFAAWDFDAGDYVPDRFAPGPGPAE